MINAEDPAVLIVDDEEASLRAVRRALSEDCEVLDASDAAAALALMQERPVWLIISDQRMPGTSGCELLAEVGARFPAVIRVMLTGYADVDTLCQAINTGHIYHCLTKPWATHELRQVVCRGLERYRAEREREELCRELERACAQAQAEVERRGRLLARTAHELGTPVHILLNALDLAAELALPAGAEEWMRMGRRAAHWLARVLAQIMTATRLDQSQLRLRPVPVPLQPLLEGLVGRLRQLMSGRDLNIAVDVRPAWATAMADRHWIEHAIWNLLTNAVRFTPDGGSVRIEAAQDDRATVVSVRDSGTGISAEHLDDLFEPFSTAAGSPLLHTSGALDFGARGVGLGLSTVRRILEAHGGAVRVTSAPHEGSCFTLELPATAAALSPRAGLR
jgi:signal transduction histidine kinase